MENFIHLLGIWAISFCINCSILFMLDLQQRFLFKKEKHFELRNYIRIAPDEPDFVRHLIINGSWILLAPFVGPLLVFLGLIIYPVFGFKAFQRINLKLKELLNKKK